MMDAALIDRSASVIRSIATAPELANALAEEAGRISYTKPGKRRELAQRLLQALGVENVVNPSKKDEDLLGVIHWTICEFFNSMRDVGNDRRPRTKPALIENTGGAVKHLVPLLQKFFEGDEAKNSMTFNTARTVSCDILGNLEVTVNYEDSKATKLIVVMRDPERWGLARKFTGGEFHFEADHPANRELFEVLNERAWDN